MSYLKDKRLYLSGPIEFGDSVVNWRDKPKSFFENQFGLQVFDPFADEKQKLVSVLDQAKKDKDYDTITKICKGFCRKDLSLVDRADILVAYLPYKVPTTGTVHEIINANNAKKPTLLVTNKDCITNIPLWYFGFIQKEFMFAGWDELYSYLIDVNAGKHKNNNRWSFVYGEI